MTELILYLGLIFSRIFALCSVLPILSSRQIPIRLRVIFSFLLSIILLPAIKVFLSPLPEGMLLYALAILGQALLGALIGFLITIIMSAFQIVGELFSLQMGTSFAEILDPQANVSLPVLGLLKNSIAMLIFISLPFQMGGMYMPALHHTLRVLSFSIETTPYFHFWTSLTDLQSVSLGGIIATLDQGMHNLFLTAIQLALPIMGILFISSLVLGLFGRTAPQFNLVNIGGQLNIGLGLLFMIILSPVFIPIILDSLVLSINNIQKMFFDWSVLAK